MLYTKCKPPGKYEARFSMKMRNDENFLATDCHKLNTHMCIIKSDGQKEHVCCKSLDLIWLSSIFELIGEESKVSII